MNRETTLFTESGDESNPVPMARPITVDGPPPVPPHPMLLSGVTRRQAAVDIIKLVAVLGLTYLAVESMAAAVDSADLQVDARVVNIGLTLFLALVLLVATGIIVSGRGQTASSIGLCMDTWWSTGLFGIVGAVAAYAVMVGTMGVTSLLAPAVFHALTRNPDRIAEILPRLHPLGLIALALAVGLYEEIIFRGFLLTRLQRVTGSAAVAVVLSSAIFAGLHAGTQELFAVIPLFLIGVTWAVLTLRLRSVVPAIIGHGLFDLCQMLVMYFSMPNWD